MGKGSDQRKKQISDLEFAERWEQIFGKNNANAKKYKWKKTKETRKKFL